MKIVEIQQVEEANAITHNGVFHADEVLATAILDEAFDGVTVCRVPRVPSNVPSDAIVYDIGGGAYDHHQPWVNSVRPNGVPYSSAGLVWRDFGMRLLEESERAEWMWEMIDAELVQGVDAVDNGVGAAFGDVRQMTFSSLVSLLNPSGADDLRSYDEAFCNAVAFAQDVLDCMIIEYEKTAKATRAVERAIAKCDDHVMVLRQYLPWKQTLLESDNPHASEIYYVVYPSARGGYNWQCVPISSSNSKHRKPVPRSWRGLSDRELQMACGVSDARFCHKSGFLGAADSRAGAVKMAQIAAWTRPRARWSS